MERFALVRTRLCRSLVIQSHSHSRVGGSLVNERILRITIRRILNRCFTCKRFDATLGTDDAALPSHRL